MVSWAIPCLAKKKRAKAQINSELRSIFENKDPSKSVPQGIMAQDMTANGRSEFNKMVGRALKSYAESFDTTQSQLL